MCKTFSVWACLFIFTPDFKNLFLNLSTTQLSSQPIFLSVLSDTRTAAQGERITNRRRKSINRDILSLPRLIQSSSVNSFPLLRTDQKRQLWMTGLVVCLTRQFVNVKPTTGDGFCLWISGNGQSQSSGLRWLPGPRVWARSGYTQVRWRRPGLSALHTSFPSSCDHSWQFTDHLQVVAEFHFHPIG